MVLWNRATGVCVCVCVFVHVYIAFPFIFHNNCLMRSTSLEQLLSFSFGDCYTPENLADHHQILVRIPAQFSQFTELLRMSTLVWIILLIYRKSEEETGGFTLACSFELTDVFSFRLLSQGNKARDNLFQALPNTFWTYWSAEVKLERAVTI